MSLIVTSDVTGFLSAWTLRTSPASMYFKSVCWSPELRLFCAVGSNNSYDISHVLISSDGVTWTEVSFPNPDPGNLDGYVSVCWSSDLKLFCAVIMCAGLTNVIALTSPDGTNWTARYKTSTNSQTYNAVCWSPERMLFCAVTTGKYVVNTVYTSTNGVTWINQTGGGNNIGWMCVGLPRLRSFARWAGGGADHPVRIT